MLSMRFPGGAAKALTLSYDDGVEQDVRLIDILDKAGIRCTFNLNSGIFAPEGFSWPQGQIHRRMCASAVRALYDTSRHEVAVHTLTHPDLTRLPVSGMVREIYGDRRNLEDMFGVLVRGAAYPFGTYSDETVDALRDCGIVYCRTVEASHGFDIPRDWLRLKATCHHGDPMLEELCTRFLEQTPRRDEPALFYLWGHSYEFEANDNWDLIERFAARMGYQPDIWYATNIEIYDYVAAWRGMLWSADGRKLRNTSALTLWARTDSGRTLEIPAGATVAVED